MFMAVTSTTLIWTYYEMHLIYIFVYIVLNLEILSSHIPLESSRTWRFYRVLEDFLESSNACTSAQNVDTCNLLGPFQGIQIVTNTPTADSDGALMMGLRATSYEFGARRDEARNSRSFEWGTLEVVRTQEVFSFHSILSPSSALSSCSR